METFERLQWEYDEERITKEEYEQMAKDIKDTN